MKISVLDNPPYNPDATFYIFQHTFQNYHQLFNKKSSE